ncbi:MAG TPA: hypothetical protein VJ645_03810 [Gaiellaceae bacterium]|nr:hypothetical protein [Gaiellaceae bacterium]
MASVKHHSAVAVAQPIPVEIAAKRTCARCDEENPDHKAELAVLRDGFERLSDLGEHTFASTNAMMIAWALCHLGGARQRPAPGPTRPEL